MITLFRKWLGRRQRSIQPSRAKRPAARRRLCPVERLEDRMMLSTSDFLLELGGIDGEASDHVPARIEIESFSFGVNRPGAASQASQQSGAGRATILDFVKKPSAQPSAYLTYELQDVLISSYQIGSSGGGNTIATESISLNFAMIVFAAEDGDRDVFVRAEKHPNVVTQNDETHWVGHDRATGRDETLTVSISRTETVGSDETITIHVNRTETVNNNEIITIGGNRTETVGNPNSATDQFFFALAPRDYCVQYREPDFDFASRLMEEEGIFYSFQPASGNVQVNIVDFIDEDDTSTPFNFFQVGGGAAGSQPCGGPGQSAGPHLTIALVAAPEYFANLIGSPEYYDYPGAYGQPEVREPPIVMAGEDATVGEGQAFSQTGSFTDNNPGPWIATVDYGDGSGEQPLMLNADKSFSLHHTYIDDGIYTATVRVTEEQALVGEDTLSVTAQNALPQITSTTIAPTRERQLATLQGTIADANPFDPLTVTIDWGDGQSPQILPLPSGVRTFQSTHRYMHDGQFAVKVSVMDDDGSIATSRVRADVQNVDIIVVGSDSGSPGQVQVLDSNTHALKFNLAPYEAKFRGGVHVATGDVNGDGIPDIITAPGAGRQAEIKVFDGISGQRLAGPLGGFLGFEKTFIGGVFVAAGDVNGDGVADIITARGSGKPEVRVFNGATGSQLSSFFAYSANFSGGVHVAAGDLNGDGRAEIITAPGAGRVGPLVKVFNGTSGALLSSFFAYNSNFQGGVSVAAGDLNGDGRAEIVTGAGPGGAPQVKVFDGATRQTLRSFLAYNPNFHGGVRVAVADLNGDGVSDIITGAGAGAAQKVRLFNGVSLAAIDSFFAFDPKSTKGVFVAGNG